MNTAKHYKVGKRQLLCIFEMYYINRPINIFFSLLSYLALCRCLLLEIELFLAQFSSIHESQPTMEKVGVLRFLKQLFNSSYFHMCISIQNCYTYVYDLICIKKYIKQEFEIINTPVFYYWKILSSKYVNICQL